MLEATATDLTRFDEKSCIEEGVAAVSSQKVHGKSSVRAKNRETQGGMSGGSQFSGQTAERPWVSSVSMGQIRVCSRCGNTHKP